MKQKQYEEKVKEYLSFLRKKTFKLFKGFYKWIPTILFLPIKPIGLDFKKQIINKFTHYFEIGVSESGKDILIDILNLIVNYLSELKTSERIIDFLLELIKNSL